MPYASAAGFGAGMAATGAAFGHLWLVASCAAVVLAGAFAVRRGFGRGLGPLDR